MGRGSESLSTLPSSFSRRKLAVWQEVGPTFTASSGQSEWARERVKGSTPSNTSTHHPPGQGNDPVPCLCSTFLSISSDNADEMIVALLLFILFNLFILHRRPTSLSSPNPDPSNTDRKGKKRAPRSPTPPTSDPLTSSSENPAPGKRPRKSSGVSVGRYELRSKGEGDTEASAAGTSLKGKSKAKAPLGGKKKTKKMPKKAK